MLYKHENQGAFSNKLENKRESKYKVVQKKINNLY